MENKTDKELFELWEINTKNNDEHNLSLIGKELVKRKYMLDTEEYNAIDYYLQDSKLYDSGFWVCQENWGEDYFHDEENEENLTLQEGLEVIYESFSDNIYNYPTDILNGLKKAIKRFLDKEI